MSMMAAGFRGVYYPHFKRAGFNLSVFLHGGDAPETGADDVFVANEAVRYAYLSGAYDPDLPKDLADRVRRRALPMFFRTFARSAIRQSGPPPEWATVHYYFENALNYYHRLLRERRVETLLFWILPHEGNFSVLYHLAQEMGVRTVICLQSHFPNSFWVMERIDAYGLSPVENDQGNVIPYDPQPDIPYYLKGLQTPFPKGKWLAQITGEGANVAARAVALQFLWRPYSMQKSIVKVQRSWRRYKHHALHDGYYKDSVTHDDFIYFPLHHQPELSADIIGRQYNDQTLAIEELRRGAPEDIAIYVKENPRQSSLMRGDAFFKRLEDLPNVHLMRHYVSTLELTAKARMVATVTGTAGYEALQMRKPVLAFGDAWYRGFPGVFDASDDAASAVAAARTHRFNDDALRAAVEARARTLWRGVVNHLHIVDPPSYDPVGNLSVVTDSLSEYLSKSAA